MRQISARLGVLALALAGGVGSILGVPARQVPLDVTQPDGSVVTLTLCGDEYFHFYKTTDGLIVKAQPDGWYRIVDNDGVPTDMPALNPVNRPAAMVSRLSGISAPTAFNNLRRICKAAQPARQVYRSQRISPMRSGAAKASYQPQWDNSDGHFLREFPAEGQQNVLIILVSFSDKDWSFCADPHTEMQNMLQQPGYSNYDCTGSAYDYFIESSRGVFRPSFDVYGPVKLPRNVAYYGGNDYYGNDLHPEQMVIDACDILDSEIDFSKYDRDGDGVVDNIYVFYAGYGEADGGAASTVWPHSWDIRYAGAGNVSHDGVLIGHYACSNELNYRNQMTGIGTFCHEFSHVLGLPDLYATEYTGAHTPGEYSLMDHGSYNNNGRTPPIYSAYERYALEWQKPNVIATGEDIRTRGLTDGGNTYKITIDPARPTEYFLFENRQPIGNDVTLPGHGMLVWHIDYKSDKWNNNKVNNTPSDQCIDIVEADGGYSDTDTNGGSTFPGTSGATEFSATTTPAFANKNGAKSKLAISKIANPTDGVLSFRVGDGMDENSDYPIETPYMRPESIGSDSFTVAFKGYANRANDKGGGGEVLIVSVESNHYDEDKEEFVSEPLEGFNLIRVASENTLKVTGVQPSSTYTVKAYRESSANMSEPYTISVLTAGEDVADTRTTIAASNIVGDAADLNWAEVEGADHYLLTVATREQTASSESMTADFTDKKLPSGWEAIGVYTQQAGNFGAAPWAFYMSEKEDYLWTEFFDDKEIESIQFWGRVSRENSVGLNIYSATRGGSISFLGTVEGLTTKGQTITFDNIPEGTQALVFLPSNADNRTLIYLDDIKINFKGQPVDTPVGEYADLAVNANGKRITGLQPKTSYVAYVKAHDGTKAGAKSNAVAFTTAENSGVDGIESESGCAFYIDADGTLRCTDSTRSFDIYAIDGTQLARSASDSFRLPARGIYVVRVGAKSVKVRY